MIKLYTDENGETELTDYSLTTMHNGFTGENYDFSLYVGNDDDQKKYVSVKVELLIIQEFLNNGWDYKAYVSDTELSEQEWSEINLGESATISEVDESLVKVNFRLICPAGETSDFYNDKVSIKITATEVSLQ